MPKYRILSIDGGGIRGVLTATLLERLAVERPGFLDQIDQFAGTSTGGLLALGLASGMAPSEIKALYIEKGPIIFADTFWDNLKDLGFAIGAQFSLGPLKTELERLFSDATLGVLDKRVVITSFDLKDPDRGYWKAKIFHNYPGDDSDADEKVVDVALRTSAAPTFFPVYQHYIDGGVVANNPSMCGLAQALDRRVAPEHRARQIEEVVILSLGTGRNPAFLDAADADWGWANWGVRLASGSPPRFRLPLFEIMLDGHADLARFQCEQILQDRFWRLNPALPEPIGLDAFDQIDVLIRLAAELDLAPTIEWINEVFD